MEMTMNRKLGEFIKEVDVRNKDLSITLLLGVSNEKYFMPSIANIVGTDLSNYKIVRKNQFAFGTVTSRNGDKISIALLKEEECIVSSSYVVFEIIDTNRLDPDYLDMWFRRDEFDRYVRFMSHGSVREIFSLEKMKEVELPVPDIAVQKQYVNQYKALNNAIKLKEQINNNLYESGKTYLKQLYDSREDLFSENITLENYCKRICSGGTPSRENREYYANGSIPWLKNGEIKCNIILDTEEKITESAVKESSAKILDKNSVSMAMYCVSEVQVSFNAIKLATNQAVLNFETRSFTESCFVHYLLASYGNALTSKAFGSAQQNLSKDTIKVFEFKKPLLERPEFNYFKTNIELRIKTAEEIIMLNKLKQLLISSISKQ